MVLYPLSISESVGSPAGTVGTARRGQAIGTVVSAWEAVERKQKEDASAWWLIAQPDHAALAGDLAAKICCSYFPKLDADVVEAITLHDAGWARFDGGSGRGSKGLFPGGGAPIINRRDRPLSFLDMSPDEFLRAWSDSISRAEESSSIGGILVSRHFCRLAEGRLRIAADGPQELENLERFIGREAERQRRLAGRTDHSEEEICTLVDVLQFCDLLSLYLCCGAHDDVEFPQKFQGHSILLRRDGEMCRLEPSIFGGGVSLGVSARRYPSGKAETNLNALAFLLA